MKFSTIIIGIVCSLIFFALTIKNVKITTSNDFFSYVAIGYLFTFIGALIQKIIKE
ncbi:MAG: hypothetical protein ACFFG0_02430 [Candidatus Thorarchaeota archaeon]